MRSTFVLPIFFAIVLLGAVVFGPLLYFAAQPVWPVPFHRAMDRALLISALAALVVFSRRLDFRSWWPLEGRSGRDCLLGLLIAAVTVQTLVALNYAVAGFSSSHPDAKHFWTRIGIALAAAILVAPAEETIFRGFLQGEFSRLLGWRGGWLVAAAIYAVVHFLKVPAELDHAPVHIWSGASALGAAFAQIGADLSHLENVAKAANLLVFGLILGGIVERSRTLWLNAGLHAGCIFGLLVFTGVTAPARLPRVAWLGGNILSNPVTTVVLLLLGLWIWRFYRHPSVQPETGAAAP